MARRVFIWIPASGVTPMSMSLPNSKRSRPCSRNVGFMAVNRQPSTVNLALVEGLEINVVPSKALAAAARESLLDLCSRAYQEDFTAYLQLLSPAVHVCGWLDESLVSNRKSTR